MASGVLLNAAGFEQTLRFLANFDKDFRKSGLKKVLAAGAKPVLSLMRSKVPEDTGILKKSLAIRVTAKPNGDVAFFVVGPRTGFKREGINKRGVLVRRWATKYTHLAEAFYPFLKESQAESREASLAAMEAKLRELVEK